MRDIVARSRVIGLEIGAGEGKPPLSTLDVDIIADFSATLRRLVAGFVVFRTVIHANIMSIMQHLPAFASAIEGWNSQLHFATGTANATGDGIPTTGGGSLQWLNGRAGSKRKFSGTVPMIDVGLRPMAHE